MRALTAAALGLWLFLGGCLIVGYHARVLADGAWTPPEAARSVVLVALGGYGLVLGGSMLREVGRWWRAAPREDVAGVERNPDGTFGRIP